MKEYFEHEGISSGQLQKFKKSPAHAVEITEQKSVFGVGHYFEHMIEDACTGSTHCRDEYLVCEAKGDIPPEIFLAIENKATVEEMKKMEVLTKGGERSRTKARFHDWLDFAILREQNKWHDKTMISIVDVNICKIMFKNFHDLELFGIPIMDLLKHPNAKWQYPVYWRGKKALFDCVLVDVQGFVIPVDFKTTAKLSQFEREVKSGKWIQAVHYEEGARETWNMPVYPMQFLIASKSKEDLYLSQRMEIDEESYQALCEEYDGLCGDYEAWVQNGQPVSGALHPKTIKIWGQK